MEKVVEVSKGDRIISKKDQSELAGGIIYTVSAVFNFDDGTSSFELEGVKDVYDSSLFYPLSEFVNGNELLDGLKDEGEPNTSALSAQVGGDHYKDRGIQPIEYIHSNGLNFIEGSVVKYITRWREKGGVEDLNKIKHYIDLLIELESK